MGVACAAATHPGYIVSSGGRLTFPADADDYKIPDFSHAGYLGSDAPLPVFGIHYEGRIVLSDPNGDDTARIQAAIDAVSALTPNVHGYRGAVVLGAGTWHVTTLHIDESGVVLRGAGMTSTFLQCTAKSGAQVVRLGTRSATNAPVDLFTDGKTGIRWNITNAVVHVGDRTFDITPGHALEVGDLIVIEHPCTPAWLAAVRGGGVNDDPPWSPGSVPIRYHRRVVAAEGNAITIDAPVMYSLVRSLSPSFVYKYTAMTIQKLGIEHLTIDNDAGTNSLVNIAPADSVRFNRAVNSWARHVRTQNFSRSGFYFAESTRLTIESCEANDPHSVVEASRRYGFNCRGGQLILFRECYGRRNRHTFITNGHGNDGGNVYLRCTAEDNYAATEHGHQRWSNGSLFDGCTFRQAGAPEHGQSFNPQMLWLGNHGDNSNGHGWAAVTAIVYRCTVEAPGYAVVARPPTGMNYEIDCTGDFRSAHATHGDFPGALDTPTFGPLPQSLFEAQLAQRRADL